ncbi:MAG: hypothetical protein HC842_04515 [Cytophagales bacterium]|nr:hypothetical protein [Cytophagales bacterium]
MRGAASLQYGTQFGGMLNFVMKRGPESGKPVELLSKQTAGSYGYLGSYNSVMGRLGKADYHLSYQRKQGQGWRQRSAFYSNALFADVNIDVTERFFICFEYSHYDYLTEQAGGLNQALFDQDPRQASKADNWFRVDWNVMANLAEYKLSGLDFDDDDGFDVLFSASNIRYPFGILRKFEIAGSSPGPILHRHLADYRAIADAPPAPAPPPIRNPAARNV